MLICSNLRRCWYFILSWSARFQSKGVKTGNMTQQYNSALVHQCNSKTLQNCNSVAVQRENAKQCCCERCISVVVK